MASRLPGSLVLSATLACTLAVSACQDRSARVPYIFQIAPEAVGAAALTPAGNGLTAHVPNHLGVITVNIQGFLNDLSKRRRVLATVADVFYVTITVRAADGAEFSQTIEKAAITNGQTTATFSGLAPGDATVTMKAFDTTNRAIGSSTQTATITAGQNTTVSLALTLDPTYTGGSSGGGASTGSLTANATITDGPVVNDTAPAPGVGSFSVDAKVTDIALDAEGDIWLTRQSMDEGELLEYSPSGVKKSTRNADAVSLAVHSDGSVWTISSAGFINQFAANGQTVAFPTIGWGGNWIATTTKISPSGKLWTIGGDEYAQYLITDVDQEVFKTVGVDNLIGGFREFVFGQNGKIWAVGEEAFPAPPAAATSKRAYLYEVNPDCTIQARHAMASRSISATFTEAEHKVDAFRYQGVTLDPTGKVWFSSHIDNAVYRFDPTTSAITGTYFVGWKPTNMVTDAQGRVWVNHQDGLSRLTADGQVQETVPIKNLRKLQAGASGVWGIEGSQGASTVYHIAH